MNNRKKLKELLEGVEIKSIEGLTDISVSGVAVDSRLVKEGFLFVALKGAVYDGHNFISQARHNGAKVIVLEDGSALKTLSGAVDCFVCCEVVVSDCREALARIAHNFYDKPAGKIKITGITGTNGKTTVSYLSESIFKKAGFLVGVFGTVNYRYGLKQIPAVNTTPDALRLAQILYSAAAGGIDHIVMEVSSHSLRQRRVCGIDFKTAVFTNITPEHLDYHKNIDDYKKAKAMLFENLSKKSTAVINTDDNFSKELSSRTGAVLLKYGLTKGADISPEKISFTNEGTKLSVNTQKGRLEFFSRLLGRFNIYNILASIGVALAEDIDADSIVSGIEALEFIPGRLQEVCCGQPFKVYVDYAHTDDALKNVLTALRQTARGRIITLFGCGGDRDVSKRPRMGRVAGRLSDYCFITTDNPRNEDPGVIAKQILGGIAKDKLDKSFIVLDRQEAIKKAIGLASHNDIVLLAGKGHETYQIFKNVIQPFDDKKAAEKALSSSGYVRLCLQ